MNPSSIGQGSSASNGQFRKIRFYLIGKEDKYYLFIFLFGTIKIETYASQNIP